MKILFYFIVILLFSNCGARESDTCHTSIPVTNNSSKEIYVMAEPGYPDTTGHGNYGKLASQSHIHKIQSGAGNSDALSLRDCLEKRFTGEYAYDTLMIFIFDAYMLEHSTWDAWDTWETWDTLVKYNVYNMLQQRYDLSLENLQQLGWSLPFPPTEAMKHMKMYPPYGTYK
jgi:hypothetical protein